MTVSGASQWQPFAVLSPCLQALTPVGVGVGVTTGFGVDVGVGMGVGVDVGVGVGVGVAVVPPPVTPTGLGGVTPPELAGTHSNVRPLPLMLVPTGQPQTPLSILPPLQVIESFRLVHTPLTLVCPSAQIGVVGVAVAVGVGVATGVDVGVVVGVTTGVVVGVAIGVGLGTGAGVGCVPATGTHPATSLPLTNFVPNGHWIGATGGVPPWIKRVQFGGVPTNGDGQDCAAAQFGGVPVRPGGQTRLLP